MTPIISDMEASQNKIFTHTARVQFSFGVRSESTDHVVDGRPQLRHLAGDRGGLNPVYAGSPVRRFAGVPICCVERWNLIRRYADSPMYADSPVHQSVLL